MAWPANLQEAYAWQQTLRQQVRTVSDHGPIRRVAGVDVSNSRAAPTLYAAAVLLAAETLTVIEQASASAEPLFPYVPGYLSFRETPVVQAAMAALSQPPDLVVVDGHGLAHPRRFGIACHIGVMLDVPTIGCAKKLLVGHHEPVGPDLGDRQPILQRGEMLGYALRTSRRGGPVFVSPGHRVDVEEAAELVLAYCRGYRLPEPTRQAHLYANEVRRQGAARAS